MSLANDTFIAKYQAMNKFRLLFSREEDRDILVELKTKGASSKTFAALSSKLRKSQAQVFFGIY